MDAKFTPGPWQVDDGGDGELEVWAPETDLRTICQLGTGLDVLGLDEDANRANASLIAAAPELYAACVDILVFLKRSGYDTRIVEGALAKARGEA